MKNNNTPPSPFFSPLLLTLSLCFLVCQTLWAEKEPTTASGEMLDITVTPHIKMNPVTAPRQEQSDAWDYFLKRTKIIDQEVPMHLFETLHYRKYNIIEFLEDMEKYGNNPLLWLARKNAASGRLAVAEKTVTTLLGMEGGIEAGGIPYAYELLGNIKMTLKKFPEAASAYESAIKMGNVNVYEKMAFVSMVSGDHQTVAKLIPELMKIKNKNTSALNILISFSQITGNMKLFRESIEGVEESNLASDPRIFINVISGLLKTGNSADSLMADRMQQTYPRQLASAIELLRISGSPNDLTLADRLQKALDAISDKQNLPVIQQAVKIDPVASQKD
jgi:tetratricopeptide (TPR) repeat protein